MALARQRSRLACRREPLQSESALGDDAVPGRSTHAGTWRVLHEAHAERLLDLRDADDYVAVTHAGDTSMRPGLGRGCQARSCPSSWAMTSPSWLFEQSRVGAIPTTKVELTGSRLHDSLPQLAP